MPPDIRNIVISRGPPDPRTGDLPVNFSILVNRPPEGFPLPLPVRITFSLRPVGVGRPVTAVAAGIPPPAGPALLSTKMSLPPGGYTLWLRGDTQLSLRFVLPQGARTPVRLFCRHKTLHPTFRDHLSALTQKGEILASSSVVRFSACCRKNPPPWRPLSYPPRTWVLLHPIGKPQRFWIGDRVVAVSPREYLLVNPSEQNPFTRLPETAAPIRQVWLMPPAFTHLWESVCMPYPLDAVRFPTGPHALDAPLQKEIAKLETAMAKVAALEAPLATHVACQDLILTLFRRHLTKCEALPALPKKTFLDPRLKLAIEYLENYYAEMYQSAEVARHACASPEMLWKLFRKHLKQTPNHYLQAVRVRKAKELACTSSLTIAQIAEAVGYQDARNFRRIFLAHTQKPLSAFR